MALRNILLEGDETLRKKSRPVTDFGKRTAALMDDLRETLIDANGAGLAAPQVGILRRAVIILDGEEYVELINPEITWRSDETEAMYEGCLSCPNQRALIERPYSVTVRAFDRDGNEFERTCEEIAARAVCHELDHLEGVLFVDLADEIFTEDELEEMFGEDGE